MKNRIYLIALLFAGCLISSCESDETSNDDITYQNEFEKSKDALRDFKNETHNSYEYTVVSSSWIGVAWETTIVVSKGKVNHRLFKFTNTTGIGANFPKEELEWTESGSEIGSHKNYAAAVLTLDQIYIKAQEEWLKEKDDVKTYFETENNGLISTCGYVENGCQDDCFRGIHIKSIKALKQL
jgi:hypothetical protein